MIAFNSTSGTYKLTYQETPKPLNDEPGTQRGARLVKQMVSTENLLRRPIDDTPENVMYWGQVPYLYRTPVRFKGDVRGPSWFAVIRGL